jgi:hypothetical protein
MQDNNKKCSYYKSFIDYLFSIQLNRLHQVQRIQMEYNETIFNPNAQLMHQYLKKIKIRNKTID